MSKLHSPSPVGSPHQIFLRTISLIWALIIAPSNLSTGSPPLNKTQVGSAEISYFVAIAGYFSVSILTIDSLQR